MLPDTTSWPVTRYFLGGVFLAVGIVVAAIGLAIRRRQLERHRDLLYVRQGRGEEVAAPQAPRRAVLLERIGAGIGGIGIVLLLAEWSTAPGQS